MNPLTLRVYPDINQEFNVEDIPEKDRLRTWGDFVYYALENRKNVCYGSTQGVYVLKDKSSEGKLSPLQLFQEARRFAQVADDRGLAKEVFQDLKKRMRHSFYSTPILGLIRRILSLVFSRFNFEKLKIFEEISSTEEFIATNVSLDSIYYHVREKALLSGFDKILFSPNRAQHKANIFTRFRIHWSSFLNFKDPKICEVLSHEFEQLIPALHDPFRGTLNLHLNAYFNSPLSDLVCESLLNKIKLLPKEVQDCIEKCYEDGIVGQLDLLNPKELNIKEVKEGDFQASFFYYLREYVRKKSPVKIKLTCTSINFEKVIPYLEGGILASITALDLILEKDQVETLFQHVKYNAEEKKPYPQEILLRCPAAADPDLKEAFNDLKKACPEIKRLSIMTLPISAPMV